jgi:hypothetical protein
MRKLIAIILLVGGLYLGASNYMHYKDMIGPKPGFFKKLSFVNRWKEKRTEEAGMILGIIIAGAGTIILVTGKKKDK